jgi:hypothetical protein
MNQPAPQIPRRSLWRFSLKWLFLAMLLGAGLLAWFRPGAPRPELSVHRGFYRGMGNFHLYRVRYPNGASEEYLDMLPYGSMDIAHIDRAPSEVGRFEFSEIGRYENAKSQGLWNSKTRYEGLIRPGDEVLCEARFQAILAEVRRREVDMEQIEYFGTPRVLSLPLRWPRLEAALRAAHAKVDPQGGE